VRENRREGPKGAADGRKRGKESKSLDGSGIGIGIREEWEGGPGGDR
jgi:hypothetical protein